MKKFLGHVRVYIFRGLLAIIPLLLSFIAITILYRLIDRQVMSFLDQFIQIRQIPGMGILLVLVCLYFVGLIVSNVIGLQVFHFIEKVSKRIPIVKAIYAVGKQLSESLSTVEGDKKAFQKAVLVDCNNNGIWTIAFVTGMVKDQQTGENLVKVFVPTVPNPTTGFIFFLKISQIRDMGWSVEEAVKAVVSAGIISPPEIKK